MVVQLVEMKVTILVGEMALSMVEEKVVLMVSTKVDWRDYRWVVLMVSSMAASMAASMD